jgi:hypothetical protein
MRTCPCCGSNDHVGPLYGLGGSVIYCNRCPAVLANRRDIEAAPIDLTEAQAEDWMWRGSGVLSGAEALDPADDEMFGPNRWPVPASSP